MMYFAFGSYKFINTDIFHIKSDNCIYDRHILYLTATKAMNTDIKRQQQEGLQPCLHVFDIVLLNDKVLTNQPLTERLKIIQTVFEPEEGRILLSQHKEARTKYIFKFLHYFFSF